MLHRLADARVVHRCMVVQGDDDTKETRGEQVVDGQGTVVLVHGLEEIVEVVDGGVFKEVDEHGDALVETLAVGQQQGFVHGVVVLGEDVDGGDVEFFHDGAHGLGFFVETFEGLFAGELGVRQLQEPLREQGTVGLGQADAMVADQAFPFLEVLVKEQEGLLHEPEDGVDAVVAVDVFEAGFGFDDAFAEGEGLQ